MNSPFDPLWTVEIVIRRKVRARTAGDAIDQVMSTIRKNNDDTVGVERVNASRVYGG